MCGNLVALGVPEVCLIRTGLETERNKAVLGVGDARLLARDWMLSGAGLSGVLGGDLFDHGELFSLRSVGTGLDLTDTFEDGVPRVLEAGEFTPLLPVRIFTFGYGGLCAVSGSSAEYSRPKCVMVHPESLADE